MEWGPIRVVAVRNSTSTLRLENELAWEGVGFWPISAVLRRLAKEAASWYVTAASRTAQHGKVAKALLKPRPHGTASQDELLEWVVRTESLVNRLPLRTSAEEAMRTAAAAVRQQLQWAEPYFVKVPPLGSKADADLHLSVVLWAMAQLRDAVGAVERRAALTLRPNAAGKVTVLKPVSWNRFWETICGNYVRKLTAAGLPEPPFADVRGAEKRIARLSANLKPGAAAELMQAVISDVIVDIQPYLQSPAMPEAPGNVH